MASYMTRSQQAELQTGGIFSVASEILEIADALNNIRYELYTLNTRYEGTFSECPEDTQVLVEDEAAASPRDQLRTLKELKTRLNGISTQDDEQLREKKTAIAMAVDSAIEMMKKHHSLKHIIIYKASSILRLPTKHIFSRDWGC